MLHGLQSHLLLRWLLALPWGLGEPAYVRICPLSWMDRVELESLPLQFSPQENLPGRPVPTEVTLLQHEEGFLEIICTLN